MGQSEFWFRYNPFKFRGGLCIPKAANISKIKFFLIIVFGPLASILTATFFFNTLYLFGVNSAFTLISLFGVLFSFGDFIINLIPLKIKLSNGEIFYSDGYQLLHGPKASYPDNYGKGCDEFLKENYTEAAQLFTSAIENGYKTENIYRLAYLSYLLCEDYVNSIFYLQMLEKEYSLTDDDYNNYGYLGSVTGVDIDPEYYFRKAIQLNPKHHDALNGLGYLLVEKEQFAEAITYLNKAIQISPEYAFAYNNRGLAKTELGLLKEGLADIQYSLLLNDQNAYVYRNLGIYYLRNGDKEQAKALFSKAKQMDENTARINELICQVDL